MGEEGRKNCLSLPRPGPTIFPKEEPLPLCYAETLRFTTCASGTRRRWRGGRAQEMSHAEGAEYAELVYTQRTQRAQSLCAAQRYPCHPCETFALGGTQQHL